MKTVVGNVMVTMVNFVEAKEDLVEDVLAELLPLGTHTKSEFFNVLRFVFVTLPS